MLRLPWYWESASEPDKNKSPSPAFSSETLPNRCVSPSGGSQPLLFDLCALHLFLKGRVVAVAAAVALLCAFDLIACWISNFHTKFMFPAPAPKYKIKITPTTCSRMINVTIFMAQAQWINN